MAQLATARADMQLRVVRARLEFREQLKPAQQTRFNALLERPGFLLAVAGLPGVDSAGGTETP